MKRIKKKNLAIFLLLNVLIALTISYLVVSIAKERNVTQISFERNIGNKYNDFLKSIGVSTSYELPPAFMRRLDDMLRKNQKIFGLKNQCINIKKLKGTLPISFVMKEGLINIEITAHSRDEVTKCSNYILKQMELYNERVRERYRENYIYFDSLENKEEIVNTEVKKINVRLDQIFTLFDKILLNEISGNSNGTISGDLNLRIINTYLGLNSYIEQKEEKRKLKYFLNKDKITKENFFSVVNKITPIVFKGEFSYIQSTPKFYKIFISTYSIFVFLYVLSIVLIKNTAFKKIFS